MKFSINSISQWKRPPPLFFYCFWISHLFNTVELLLLEKVLKHFRYFQPLLVLQENSTNSTHSFHIENSTETQVFLISIFSALLQDMGSWSEASYSNLLSPFFKGTNQNTWQLVTEQWNRTGNGFAVTCRTGEIARWEEWGLSHEPSALSSSSTWRFPFYSRDER